SAGTAYDPRASTVELGEALHEGQTHPDPRGMPGRGAGGLAERFEDLLAELGRDPRSVVLDHEQQATVRRNRTHPHLGFRRRVPEGVREEVLDDPLDLRGIKADDEWFYVAGQVVSVIVYGLLLYATA